MERLRRLLAPLLLALIVTGFFWKLVLTAQFTWLASDDISTQVMPWIQFQSSEWHAGRIPLWDPTAWGGQPLLAQAIPGTASPLNWPLFLAPLKHGWIRQSALHWYYVLTRTIAALAMYALCRDLGRSRTASIAGAALFGTAGYFGSVEYPQIVNSGIWAPLVFLFQFRVARGVKPFASAVFHGFFLGVVWLSGHHQVPIFVSLASGFLWLHLTWRQRVLFRLAVLGGCMAFAVGALQILPTVEYGRQAIRWVQAEQPVGWHDKVPYKVHEDYSIKPLSLLSIVIPGMDRTVNPHIGVVAFGLALVGAAAAWRDRRARWLAVIALGAFVFSLGPATLLHGILYATIPLVEKARAPAQALMLVHLGLCSLAAFGLDAARGTATRVAAYGLCATGILLAAVGFVLFKMGTLAIQGDSRFMVTALAALVAAVVLWMAPHRWSALVLFGLMLVETSGTSAQFTIYERQKERLAKLRQMAEDSDIIEYVRQQTSKPFRVEYDGEVFPHNLGNWWGIETFSTYNASAPDIVMRNDPYNPRVQAMLGVRYYLGTKPIRPDLVEVFRGVSGRTVYAYPNAFPRAWTVHEILQVKVSDTSKALADPSVDLTRKAIVTRAVPPLEQCAGDQVRVSRHEANRVEIEAEMRCRGLVVLSETWFPGWRATVDGRPMEVYDADGMVRGVVVDGGRHAVVLTYRPWTVVVGAMLLLTATLFAAVVYWRQR